MGETKVIVCRRSRSVVLYVLGVLVFLILFERFIFRAVREQDNTLALVNS